MRKTTKRIIASLMGILMICAALPINAFAAGKKEVSFYNPVTKATSTVVLNADTQVAAIWADDSLTIQAQGKDFTSMVDPSSKKLLWGANQEKSEVIYLIIGTVTLDFSLMTQGNGKYIVGADDSLAMIRRGPHASSDLISVGENCTLDFWNITLDGGCDSLDPHSICNTKQTGGLLAVDGHSVLTNCTLQNDYIDDYVPDHASEDHGTGTLRITANNNASISASVVMENCKVIRNFSYGNGSGIYIGTAGTLTLKGNTIIQNNTSLNVGAWRGAGIYMKDNAALKMEGTVIVKDNQTNSQSGLFDSDIYVGRPITVTGPLSGSIGIDSESRKDNDVFGTGTNMQGTDPADATPFFHNGHTHCHVHRTASGSVFCTCTPVPAVNHVLQYDRNGGSGTMPDRAESSSAASVVLTADDNGFTAPSGKEFDSWNTNSDGSGLSYRPGDSVPVEESLTLYAIWKDLLPDTHVIQLTYHGNDAEGSMLPDSATVEFESSAEFTVKDNGFIAPIGKRFSGWNTQADGTGTFYAPGSLLTAKENILLYAIWEDTQKVSQPGIDKKADGTDEIGKVAPGQPIAFTLHSTVPEEMAISRRCNPVTGHWELSSDYTLVFHDTLTGPITFNNDITIILKDTLLSPSYYSVIPGTNGETFSVSVDLTAAFNAGLLTWDDMGTAPVVVSYTAVVDVAATHGSEVLNQASVNETSVVDTVQGSVVALDPPPVTGGSGTLLFTLLGSFLMVGAATVQIVNRRKSKA